MLKISILIALFGYFSIVLSKQAYFDLNLEQEEINSGANETTTGDLTDTSLLWGPYRSALYFGIRPRIDRSLLSGLMWFNVDNFDNPGNIRHFYESNHDMGMANWVSFDPRVGGRQIIKDNECHIDIVIDFVKTKDGNSWGVKIKAKPHKGFENVKTSFVWYSGLESLENDADEMTSYIKLINPENKLGYKGDVKIAGVSPELGVFEMEINDGPKSNVHPAPRDPSIKQLNPKRTHHLSLRVPNDNVWRAKDIFMTILQDSIKTLQEENPTAQVSPSQLFLIRNLQNFEGNLHFVQKIYEGECEFDILYSSSFTPSENKITTKNFPRMIENCLESFNEKFNVHFELSKPFNNKKYLPFAKEIISGLLGGLSYFHGDHLVDRHTVFEEDTFDSYELTGTSEGPYSLFSLVPSRPFFPRGFYWDEGFHLLPLLDFDSDLVLEIVQSWFNLIDDNGWIAREQILGPELRSRVPEQFQVQSPHIVNPPTLMLAFTYLMEKADPLNAEQPIQIEDLSDFSSTQRGSILGNAELLRNYSRNIYPKLKAHYYAMRESQKGYIGEFDRGENNEGYRWRGRTLTHCLASGLDDYPRVLPADIAELNVDLLSWVGVMTKSMKIMASILNIEEDIKTYTKIEEDILENLNKLHWSTEENSYCDVSVDEDDNNIHVCYKGYVTLLPFMTKLVPGEDIEKINHYIDILSDPEELWSDYGIRSLSKSSELYRSGENYWRSPIWVQMNYLILDSLKHYHEVSSPLLLKAAAEKLRETYRALRLNVVNNVFRNWEKTGFIWEQYDDISGDSKGAKNFLGWTSTVLLIMTMPEDI